MDRSSPDATIQRRRLPRIQLARLGGLWNGALGDMACHTANMPVMALELWDPIAVTAVKNPGIFENETYPAATVLKFEFPERNGLAPCAFYWYDGGNLPSEELTAKLPEGFRKKLDAQRKGGNKTSAALVVGSKGMLLSENDYGAEYSLLPEGDYKNFKKPEQTLPRIPSRATTISGRSGSLWHRSRVNTSLARCPTSPTPAV